MTRQRTAFTTIGALLTSFVFFFADEEHNEGGGPMYMLQAYVPFKIVAFR